MADVPVPELPKNIRLVEGRVKTKDGYYIRTIGRLPPPDIIVQRKTKRIPKKRHPKRLPYKQSLPTFQSDTTLAYVKRVRETFAHKPEIYEEFVAIIAELAREEGFVNMMALIKRVVVLFAGHRDLLYSFDAFLPPTYELEMQADAVVIKVYEDYDDEAAIGPVSNGNRRTQGETGNVSCKFDDTVDYARGVRKTFVLQPEKYEAFQQTLEEYRSGRKDVIETVRSVVNIFQGYPNLVLGFNAFLPPGYGIHMYDPKRYTIQYRNESGDVVRVSIASMGTV